MTDRWPTDAKECPKCGCSTNGPRIWTLVHTTAIGSIINSAFDPVVAVICPQCDTTFDIVRIGQGH